MQQYHLILRYHTRDLSGPTRHLCRRGDSRNALCGLLILPERDNVIPDVTSTALYTAAMLQDRTDICQRCMERVQRERTP